MRTSHPSAIGFLLLLLMLTALGCGDGGIAVDASPIADQGISVESPVPLPNHDVGNDCISCRYACVGREPLATSGRFAA